MVAATLPSIRQVALGSAGCRSKPKGDPGAPIWNATAWKSQPAALSKRADSFANAIPVNSFRHMAPRKPDGPRNLLVGQGHRRQHVARLIALRGAGRAVRDRDEVLDGHDDSFRVESREGDIQRVRDDAGEIPVDTRVQGR